LGRIHIFYKISSRRALKRSFFIIIQLKMDQVRDILFGDAASSTVDNIPRRAALRDGRIEAAATRDEEVHCLSRLCELVRSSHGYTIYSRDPRELLGSCLRTNDRAAWKAMCDDIACGCVPEGFFRAFFETQPELAVGIVRSLVDASDIVHSVSIVHVLVVTLREASEIVRSRIAEGMHAPNGVRVVRLFATHARAVPHASRDATLNVLGALIPTIDVVRGIVGEVITSAGSKWSGADNDVVHALGHCPLLSKIDDETKRKFAEVVIAAIPRMPTVRRGPALCTLACVMGPTTNANDCIQLAVNTLVSTANATRAEEITMRGAARVLRVASEPGGAVHVLADRLLHVLDVSGRG
jgi:hypothetical protein